MFRKLRHLIILSLLLATPFSLQAREDGELVLSFFGVAHDSVSQDDNQKDDSYNFGLGAFVEANINGHFGIETGLMFVKRQYENEALGVEVVREVGRLHIPIIFKYWINDYLSVGAGPFAALKVGDVTTELNVGGVDVGQLESSADDTVEFGYDLTATLNFAFVEKTGIFIEGRYSSLFDQENSENSEEIFALIGLKVSL